MKGLKSKASRFFTKEKDEEVVPPILDANHVKEKGNEHDDQSSGLKKKPSVFGMNSKKENLLVKQTEQTIPSTLIQNDEAYNKLNKNTKANSLRTKASRFFKPNITSQKSTRKLNCPQLNDEDNASFGIFLGSFRRPAGPPPPRPPRPHSIDPDIVRMQRESSTCVLLQRTSTSSKGSKISKTTNSSDRRRQSSLRREWIPDEHEDCDEQRTIVDTHLGELLPSLPFATRQPSRCGSGCEWNQVRGSGGSSSSGSKGRGTLWRDEMGFFHFVEDI